MADVVNLPDFPDAAERVQVELGVRCWQRSARNGQNVDRWYEVPDGYGATVQAWADATTERQTDGLARARARAKRRIILYAAQQWENSLDDNAEERALDRFATAICATGAADVALGGVLNGGEKPVVQWAYNEMNELKAWAKSAYDAINRLSGETDIAVLWAAGSDPSSLPEFQ